MAKAKRVQAEEWSYVLEEDRELPRDQQSVFRLKPMSQAWKAYANDNSAMRERGEVRLRNHQIAREILLAHLIDVENFPAGAPKKWPAKGTDEEREAYLLMLGDAAVFELGHHVWDMCSLDTPPATGAPPLGNS